MNWFDSKDLAATGSVTVAVDDLYGYVLPHAGTKYTGDIIQHTFQFRPKNVDEIKRVYIYYYPANEKPDIVISRDDTDTTDANIIRMSLHSTSNCHHELYVPFRIILHYLRQWNVNTAGIIFIPVNIRNEFIRRSGGGDTRTIKPRRQQSRKNRINNSGNFYIISADFSHHMPFQYAISNENKAAHAIITNSLNSRNGSNAYINEIDDVRTFRSFIKKHPNLSFQWIGRTRSPSESAVGYLSFLIRPVFQPTKSNLPIDGIFVTCYDSQMNARECLGEWFSMANGSGGGVSWSQDFEDEFIRKVKRKAETESRLTGGQGIKLPVTRCVVTYLFKDRDRGRRESAVVIRGWHSIQTSAIYLPDVLLEHAKEDGSWISPRDTEWNISSNRFELKETLDKLDQKAGGALLPRDVNNAITLYTTRTRVKK
jgi:hypothetical protein